MIEAKVSCRKVYDVTIEGKEYKGLEKINEMAGMVYLKSNNGDSLVLDMDSLSGALQEILEISIKCKIVKASPEFLTKTNEDNK